MFYSSHLSLPAAIIPFRKIGMALACLLSLPLGALAEGGAREYRGGALPQEAFPAWEVMNRQGIARIEEGALVVATPLNKRHFYMLGTNASGKPLGEGAAWKMLGDKAAIEFRLRCESEDQNTPIFVVIVRNGSRQWQVAFYAKRINRAPAETEEWDTYRLAVSDGLLSLTSEKKGEILSQVRGSEDDRGNLLMFGSYSYLPGGENIPRQWALEYLRWEDH